MDNKLVGQVEESKGVTGPGLHSHSENSVDE